MSNYDCKGCKHRTNHTDEGFKFCSGCDRSYLGADSGYHADRYEKEEAEMSMTESEPKKFLVHLAEQRQTLLEINENVKWIEEKLYLLQEELEEYKAIGTVSEFRELKEKKYDCDIKHLVGECSYAETGCSDCIGKLKIKEALEKATEKKVRELNERKDLYVASCTLCGYLVRRNQRYCDGCGQKLDWSEGKE